MNEFEIKVLITSDHRHLVAYVKKSDHPDILIAKDLKMVHYHHNYNENSPGEVEASFIKYCCLSDDNEFKLNCHWIIAAANPTDSVKESYLATLTPKLETETHDSDTSTVE